MMTVEDFRTGVRFRIRRVTGKRSQRAMVYSDAYTVSMPDGSTRVLIPFAFVREDDGTDDGVTLRSGVHVAVLGGPAGDTITIGY